MNRGYIGTVRMGLKISIIESSFISGSSAAKIECPRDWKRHENSCYYFGQESVSWLDAAVSMNIGFLETSWSNRVDLELKKVLPPPPLGNFADISYLEENFKPHLLRDVCTLCSGALVSDSLLHMLL